MNPFEERNCRKCIHCVWVGFNLCVSGGDHDKKNVPRTTSCPSWEPNWKKIKRKYKTKENGFVPWWKKLFNKRDRN